MRDVHVSAITDTIKKLCMEANWNLGSEMLRAFDKALITERSPAGKQVLQILYPCHITSLPGAVTIECHAHRHKEATL